jgi:hypothetical protein
MPATEIASEFQQAGMRPSGRAPVARGSGIKDDDPDALQPVPEEPRTGG